MKKNTLLLLIILLAVVNLTAKTTVTQTSPDSYRVVWDIPDWQTSTIKDFTVINSADLGLPATPGAPLLPFDECKVAVPDNGSARVSIASQATKEIRLDKRLQPVPTISGNGDTDAYQYLIDENLYASAAKQLLNVLPLQRFRSLTFVPIRINPFLYDGHNSLQVVTHLEFSVTLLGDLQLNNNQPLDELSALIAQQTINPNQAAAWQSTIRDAVNYANFSLSDHWVKIETDKDGMFKLTQSQLNMLPVGDLDPRSFRLFTTGGEVQSQIISNAGPLFREVPIYVAGESDGSFDAADYILFYGRDRDGTEMNQNIAANQYINPYSQNVCYWLTFSGFFGGTPLRIAQSAAETTFSTTATTTAATVRMEEDAYQRNTIGFEWFMGKFFGSSSAEYSYPIDLEDLDTTQTQTLSLLMKQEYLRNGSDLTHHVRLKVNGVQLLNNSGTTQEWTWYGLNPGPISHTGQYFASGSNSLLINVLRSVTDNLLLDFYQVTYQKKLIKRARQFTVSVPGSLSGQNIRYDFTGGNTNLRVFKTGTGTGSFEVSEIPVTTVSGGFNFISSGDATNQFWVAQDTDYYTPASIQGLNPVNLVAFAPTYENIILTPADFLPQANSLASFYSQHFGKISRVVLQQDIFNQFNAGMPDPNAVRLFLKYILLSRPGFPAPPLTSLTLLGSGTLDWRNFSGQSATKNKVIAFQKSSTTTDDYFAMFNTDQYPELAIGRYPAKTVAELNIMLSNLEQYVTSPTPGIWHDKLVFVADDEYNGPTVGEYSHSEQLQSTSQLINRSVLIDKIFAIDYEFDEFQNKPGVRDDMMAAINKGALIWYYIGHGSFDTLGAEDYFKGSQDMGRFDNPNRLPLFVAASCDIAQFDSYAFDCLAEKVVLVDNEACIASIAATRECNGPSNVALLQKYYNYSLNLRNPIGYSLLNAKVFYTEYNSNDEKYNILGDPLLLITTPERDSTMVVGYEDGRFTFSARETVNIGGEFSAASLDETADLQVFDSDITKTMPNNSHYTFRGKTIYKGNATVVDSHYGAAFVVPDDITNGNTGLILAYAWDPAQNKDFVNYMYPVTWSDTAVIADNPDTLQIALYLNDTDFVSGDVVGSSPLLIAALSDSNGINLTDAPGHSILLILDQTVSTTIVTDYFSYNQDSHTAGTLEYQLAGLSEGNHMLQLIAFDNFNRPSVASINFRVSKNKSFLVENFLPYPNPMQKSGWFTFTVSEAADVKIAIYTIRGKKIKTLSTTASKGFNQIAWDGRDGDGDYLGNNTYFIKLTADALSGSGKAEKTEKLVIYH
jgi:hypothetical protein